MRKAQPASDQLYTMPKPLKIPRLSSIASANYSFSTNGLASSQATYYSRALHNAKTACKKSDFCFQLGGKAEFMTYK